MTELKLISGNPAVRLCVSRKFCRNVHFPDDDRASLDERLAGMNPLARFYALEREFKLNDYYAGFSGPVPADAAEVLFELRPHGLLCIDADFPDLELKSGEISHSQVLLRSAEGQEVVLELLVGMASGQVALD